MIKKYLKYLKYIDFPSILDLNSIRNELDWAHKAPKTAGDDFIKVGKDRIGAHAHYAKQHVAKFISF